MSVQRIPRVTRISRAALIAAGLSIAASCMVGDELEDGDDPDGIAEQFPAEDWWDEGPSLEEVSSDADLAVDFLHASAPRFQLPFPCGQTWAGQTRYNHSPRPSIDFNRHNDYGDKVVAAAAGRVSRVGNTGSTSYGRWIEISHGNGYTTRYAHLSRVVVSRGQQLRKGQHIGNVGSTGGSTGPHLHYEQRHNGVAQRVSFNGTRAYYYGTRNYKSRNGCGTPGAPGRINTAGAPLTVRAGPGTGYAAKGYLANGTYVTIRCQTTGQRISGTYGTTRIWDKVGNGYVSDAYVYTGSDGRVAPSCP